MDLTYICIYLRLYKITLITPQIFRAPSIIYHRYVILFKHIYIQGGDSLSPNGVAYKQRSDFLSNDEYAMYVRDNVEIGMLVRCCKSYEEVHCGDIGKVVKIDREGLHDLNLQVNYI